jgi:hypothetical protein
MADIFIIVNSAFNANGKRKHDRYATDPSPARSVPRRAFF